MSWRYTNLSSHNPAAARARVDGPLGVIATISGHHLHGLTDGEQHVALHRIRTEPESRTRKQKEPLRFYFLHQWLEVNS